MEEHEYHYKDGVYHRDNLPAVIDYYKKGKIYCEWYYKEGKLHRENGPAKIYYHEEKIFNKSYFLNDEIYYDEDIINNWEAFCKMQIFR